MESVNVNQNIPTAMKQNINVIDVQIVITELMEFVRIVTVMSLDQ